MRKLKDIQLLPDKDIQGWFRYALTPGNQRVPTLEQCQQLAREVQVLLNRFNNEQLERNGKVDCAGPVPLFLKDVSPLDWEHKKINRFKDTGGQVMFLLSKLESNIDELENYFGGYNWPFEDGSSLSADEVRDRIKEFYFLLLSLQVIPNAKQLPPSKARGRPVEEWHTVGRTIAKLVANTLQQSGHKKRLSTNNEESITVVVSAEIIKSAFDVDLTPKGFVKAMNGFNRKKPH